MKATDTPISDQSVIENLVALGRRLGAHGDRPMTLTDVIGVAEAMTSSLQPLLRRIDTTLQRELRGILRKIEQLRTDISKVHAGDISRNRIPEVGKELDEVVRSTEQATNAIMEAAETVLSADHADAGAYRQLVENQMMLIFESCSFQDLTGQRVNRVVETIKVIEDRINMLCNVIDSAELGEGPVLTDRERAKQDQLLHGPTSGGTAQADIDAMF
ncbi:MAG: chemotaxis protein [Hyphomicrobiaceae bacterium]|nr:chemotaxis protein [Hyphomicrobiaceae bacterium]